MKFLKFRVFVKIFITYVQTIISMLKKLNQSKRILEADPAFFVTINSYVNIFTIVCLGS